jgi:hypothetical protein
MNIISYEKLTIFFTSRFGKNVTGEKSLTSRFNTLNRKKHAKKFPLLFSTSDSTDSTFLNIVLSNLVYNQIWLKSSYGCWALLLQYKMGKINCDKPCNSLASFMQDVTYIV